jgi:hypothetical protein
MTYSGFLVSSPFFWISLSAFFCSAAVAFSSLNAKRWKNPQKIRSRKIIFFSVFMSVAVAAATLAIFIPGPEKILNIKLLYFFGVLAAVFFAAVRFPRAIGIPFAFLCLLSVVFTSLVLKPWHPLRETQIIGKFRVLSRQEDGITVEYIGVGAAEGNEQFFMLRGPDFAPLVDVLFFDDYYVFTGRRVSWRFAGMQAYRGGTADGQSGESGPPVLVLEEPGFVMKLSRLLNTYEESLPGISIRRSKAILRRYLLLKTYSLILEPDGTVRIST